MTTTTTMFSKPLVDLFVRVSPSDPHSKGACAISHKWYMIYYLLVERNVIDLRVTPICPHLPPPGFSKLNVGRRLPIVTLTEFEPSLNSRLHDGLVDLGRPLDQMPSLVAETEDDRDDMLTSLNVPGLSLDMENTFMTGQMVNKLKYFLLEGEVDKMTEALRKLDDFLRQLGTPFIGGQDPNYADCSLAPKLQHLRIASAYYRGFQIPDEFKHVWTYLANMYSLPAFQASCPSDRDILLHYLERVVTGTNLQELAMHKTKLFLLPKHMCLFTVPDQIRPTILSDKMIVQNICDEIRPSQNPSPNFYSDGNDLDHFDHVDDMDDNDEDQEHTFYDPISNYENNSNRASPESPKSLQMDPSTGNHVPTCQHDSVGTSTRYRYQHIPQVNTVPECPNDLEEVKRRCQTRSIYREIPPPTRKSQIYTRSMYE